MTDDKATFKSLDANKLELPKKTILEVEMVVERLREVRPSFGNLPVDTRTCLCASELSCDMELSIGCSKVCGSFPSNLFFSNMYINASAI